jgi:hypothetical protein
MHLQFEHVCKCRKLLNFCLGSEAARVDCNIVLRLGL